MKYYCKCGREFEKSSKAAEAARRGKRIDELLDAFGRRKDDRKEGDDNAQV